MSQTSLTNIGLLVVMVLVFYFLLIRPQKKREKSEKEMRAALKPGDEIITIGGVVGTIIKVKEKSVIIATGSDRTKMEFVTSAIGSVVNNKAEDPSKSAVKKEEKVEEEPKAVNRDKKVAPKKLGKKSDAEDAEKAETAETAEAAEVKEETAAEPQTAEAVTEE